MAENYLPAPIGARLRGLIATPIIAKGPATLGSAWKSHGKRLYHSFTVRKDQVDRAKAVYNNRLVGPQSSLRVARWIF